MLITKQEVLNIAYISSTITVDDILTAAIHTAEWSYARVAMSSSLYEHVAAYPSNTNYTTLLSDFIKPFIAYFSKTLMFWQQIQEGSLSPSTNDQSIYLSIYDTAKQKYAALQNYCASGGFEHYSEPVARLRAGFLIKRSLQPAITINFNPISPNEPLPQCRIFKVDDTIYLQHYTEGQWTNSGTSWPI
jgi:hypothetical protein